jgi:hypothetical protein
MGSYSILPTLFLLYPLLGVAWATLRSSSRRSSPPSPLAAIGPGMWTKPPKPSTVLRSGASHTSNRTSKGVVQLKSSHTDRGIVVFLQNKRRTSWRQCEMEFVLINIIILFLMCQTFICAYTNIYIYALVLWCVHLSSENIVYMHVNMIYVSMYLFNRWEPALLTQ